MVWNMNLCAPFLPNDSTINTHRFFQASLLLIYSLIYAVLNIYYKFCGPPPLTSEKQIEQNSENKQKSQHQSQEENSDNKQVSIKLEEMPNDSCVQFKKSSNPWKKSVSGRQSSHRIKQNVTLQEIQNYFPIVYGNFSIAMGMSIMYTPYAQQSIASIIYIVLTLVLLFLNSKRHFKCTIFVWIIMTLLILFIFNTALLQVGQSNWDKINNTCFAKQYVSFYD